MKLSRKEWDEIWISFHSKGFYINNQSYKSSLRMWDSGSGLMEKLVNVTLQKKSKGRKK